MSYVCHQCGTELQIAAGAKVARRDECEACGADLHVCLNCIHYDVNAYNQCRENSAERVLDKARANFCDYFKIKAGTGVVKDNTSKTEQLKKLDLLFK